MQVSFTAAQADYQITAELTVIGKDLLITLTGGDTPHIGTVTALTKDTAPQTIRFPSHHGRFHKDDVLAENVAAKIKNLLPGSCVITSGIHVDHISKAQIAASGPMANDLGQQIAAWLKTHSFTEKEAIYYKKDEQPN